MREKPTIVGETPRTPEQMLERARVERTLTDLVLELEEPYRTTVLLRYREGLTAEAIAKQQGVPAGTVRRRLKTALDRLRDAARRQGVSEDLARRVRAVLGAETAVGAVVEDRDGERSDEDGCGGDRGAVARARWRRGVVVATGVV